MRLTTLVRRELFERRNQLVTSFLSIALGISAIVAIQNMNFYSQKAVARELDALGTNILILPKTATLQDYYSADLNGDEIPEEYVARLTTSGLKGIDNLSPKLSARAALGEKSWTLTGILPKNEFQAKAAWQGADIFARPQGCGTVIEIPGQSVLAQETLVRRRVVETLEPDEALLGADVAASANLRPDDEFSLLGKTFKVAAVLPQTGTVDDSRIFAHLHEVQKLLGKGPVLNAIEVVGCCDQISKGLVQKINSLLPEAKVVTIVQVVDTQIRTNRMMSRLSLIALTLIALVGGASIANYMYANVFERRREIGTLMALGAGSAVVQKIFLFKALLIGLAGGLAGYGAGTAAAWILGPHIAGVPVRPMAELLPAAVLIAVGVCMAASYWPARRAARMDPSAALREF